MRAATLVSALRGAVVSLVKSFGAILAGPAGKYRPEDHYMRGPGPKWREKHLLDRGPAGRF
jgi:hypothetical protein